jgi:hypothetical protein
MSNPTSERSIQVIYALGWLPIVYRKENLKSIFVDNL